ncbi:MAG: hypothetical protein VCB42_01315, partial [Myxococcota bacterium]
MKHYPRELPWMLSVALALVIGAVWWPVFRFPYVRDDWFSLSQVHDMSLDPLLRFLAFPHQQWFRPLGTAYLWLNNQLFGFESAGFHATDLLLQACASLLVVAIAQRLAVGLWASWAAGFLYATAVTVHLDPLLWASGIFDLGGATFFFLSLGLFVSQRVGFSLIAFAIALLFKESTVVLPGVLLAYLLFMSEGDDRPGRLTRVIGRLWSFALLTGLYLAYVLGTRGLPFTRPVGHPYRMATLGEHVWNNITHYAAWSAEAVAPFAPAFSEQHATAIGAGLILAAGAVLIAILARHRGTAGGDFESSSRLALFLASWWGIGLLPAIFLSDHLYRYYLAYSLPPVLIAVSYTAQTVATRVLRSERGGRATLALAVSACIVTSGAYFWTRAEEGREQQYTSGTNSLIAMGTTVELVRSGLVRLHPVLPPGSNLVFIGLQPWAFGYRAGPNLWYGDNTLEVYVPSELAGDETGIYFKNVSPPRYLDPERTHFFTLVDGTL